MASYCHAAHPVLTEECRVRVQEAVLPSYIMAFLFLRALRPLGAADLTALKTTKAYRATAALAPFWSMGISGFTLSGFVVSGLCSAVGTAVNAKMPELESHTRYQ